MPESLAGRYTTGPIAAAPSEFNVTAQVFDAFREKICDKEYMEGHRSEIEGSIVFTDENSIGK